MTVTTNKRKMTPYNCDGAQTVFPFDFKIFGETEIVVLLIDGSGNETPLQLTTDYSVTGMGDDNGGTVTTVQTHAAPNKILIYREVALTQLVDLINGGGFDADVVEQQGFDRLCMISQQLHETITRAMRVSISAAATSLELPNPDPGKSFKWSADGKTLVNTSEDPDSYVSAAVASAAAAAASETNAASSETNAAASEAKAWKWADEAEDVEVEVGKYSARHHAIKAAIAAASIVSVPVGGSILWNGSTPPDNFLEEDGSAVDRTVYADLFTAIGTRYGAGNGTTTFNLPDKRGRFVRIWDHGAGLDVDAALIITQGDTASSSTTLTNIVADVSKVRLGAAVTGSGIPAGTTIVGVTDANTLEMSAPATAAANVTLTITGDLIGTRQDDDFESHTHTIPTKASTTVAPSTPSSNNNAPDRTYPSGATGGSETRPKNINVMSCIRF